MENYFEYGIKNALRIQKLLEDDAETTNYLRRTKLCH